VDYDLISLHYQGQDEVLQPRDQGQGQGQVL